MSDSGLKFVGENKNRVGGYLAVWGDADHKDLQGEYFTPTTEFELDWYKTRPALYHHGLDASVKGAAVGRIESIVPDDTGLWAEAQLDDRNRYAAAIRGLVEKGALAWSSGSLPHLVVVERDGRIKRWPIIEGSLTPTPAEPRNTGIMPLKHTSDVATVVAAYKSAGIDLPADLVNTDGAIESADGKDGADAQAEPRTIKIIWAKGPTIKIRS